MRNFDEMISDVKARLNYEYRDREWETEQYINQAIPYANSYKGATLQSKMDIIEEYTREQLDATVPEWMY